jgi:predicted Zn-dependent protease
VHLTATTTRRRPDSVTISDDYVTTRRRCCLGLLATLAVPALTGCTTGSSRPSMISTRKERELGQEAASEIEQTVGLVRDPALVGYVRELGRRLVAQVPQRPDASYEFQVADDAEPNAFALPGGFVYVTRGILALANSEDELAGVIGHEIGHVVARHSVRQLEASTPFALLFGVPSAIVGVVSPALGGILGGVGKLANGLVLAPYSREQEREADRIGIALAARAGSDPAGLPSMLHTLEREEALAGNDPSRPSFLANHPATPERVKDTTAAARTLTRGAAHPIAGTRAAFLARLDGLVVGPDPANGIFVNNVFQHPDLRLALEMPAGWKTNNTPASAIAAESEGRAAVALEGAGEGDDPADGARRDGLEERLVQRLTRRTIAGLPAAQLIAQDREARLHLTWIAYQSQVFRVAGVSAIRTFETYRETFARTASSFRPLRPGERDRLMEARLRAYSVRAGETLADLVTRTGGIWKVEQTAVANGVAVAARLPEGFLAKVPIRQRHIARQPAK